MPKTAAIVAYLLTPIDPDDKHGAIYAVLGSDLAEVLPLAAAALDVTPMRLSFAGVLSDELVRRLALEPGEVRRL